MSGGKKVMTEAIKNRGRLEQGNGYLPVFILCPLSLGPFAANK
jgi:hypothetical protein